MRLRPWRGPLEPETKITPKRLRTVTKPGSPERYQEEKEIRKKISSELFKEEQLALEASMPKLPRKKRRRVRKYSRTGITRFGSYVTDST